MLKYIHAGLLSRMTAADKHADSSCLINHPPPKIGKTAVVIHAASGGHELPVWIAAYGPRALATAGEHGDGVILQIADPSLVSWFVEQCYKAAKAAGKDTADYRVMAAAPAYFGSREVCIEATRWFPAMVGNHVADIVEKYGSDSDLVPRSLTEYIEKRRGYDYSKHGQSDNPYLDFITDDIVTSFAVLGNPAASAPPREGFCPDNILDFY